MQLTQTSSMSTDIDFAAATLLPSLPQTSDDRAPAAARFDNRIARYCPAARKALSIMLPAATPTARGDTAGYVRAWRSSNSSAVAHLVRRRCAGLRLTCLQRPPCDAIAAASRSKCRQRPERSPSHVTRHMPHVTRHTSHVIR